MNTRCRGHLVVKNNIDRIGQQGGRAPRPILCGNEETETPFTVQTLAIARGANGTLGPFGYSLHPFVVTMCRDGLEI